MTTLALAFLLAAGAAETDLLVNGAFEKGKDGKPDAWQLPDGLCTFWEKAPGGKCIRIDTDVLRDEFLARQKEVDAFLEAAKGKEREGKEAKGKDSNRKGPTPLPPAKPKSPTKEPKHDTVAGVEGVSYASDFIEITPGQDYRLEVDCRTDGGAKTPKVFVKGYFLDPKRPPEYQKRQKYEKYLICNACEKWQTSSMVCSPTAKTPDVKWVRVIIFAYWPPGTYYFDNIRLVPAPKTGGRKSAPGTAKEPPSAPGAPKETGK